jgi:hypothetical protein
MVVPTVAAVGNGAFAASFRTVFNVEIFEHLLEAEAG